MLAVLISVTQRPKQHSIWETPKEKIDERRQQKVIASYFKSNPMQRGLKKRMTKIWMESTKFNTSQRLADQTRLILKKSKFSDFEILGICR